ncbi:MAG: hypothetical protein A4E43_00038 [Methanosaeta sp. PtaB.Bin005]|nr:MAG: hypothetical protein A4E43_00038 [Methanosaeta sp. PtaB.Bin005]
MPMPIRTGNADIDTMVNGICKRPMAPKVQPTPRKTIGIGSRDHFTWLKVISNATIIRKAARRRMGPLLSAISAVIEFIRAGSPVTVSLVSAGKLANSSWPFVSWYSSPCSLSVRETGSSMESMVWLRSGNIAANMRSSADRISSILS